MSTNKQKSSRANWIFMVDVQIALSYESNVFKLKAETLQ